MGLSVSQDTLMQSPVLQGGAAFGSCIAAGAFIFAVRGNSLVRINAISPIIPLLCIASILLFWFITVWPGGASWLLNLDYNLNSLGVLTQKSPTMRKK
jgi:hypothetical protein